MRTKDFYFLNLFPLPIFHNSLHDSQNKSCRSIAIVRRCYFGRRSCGSRWDWDEYVNFNPRSRLSDEYLTEDYVEEEEFEIRNTENKRIWWADDFDGKYEKEVKDERFGAIEASIRFDWIQKGFRTFGWMIPAVITTLVLGNEHDSMYMALALPLAQTIFSLVTEALWKRPGKISKNKIKGKKRPFPRAATDNKPRKTKTTSPRIQKRAGDYKSWVTSSNASAISGTINSRDFGGWDE